jgi:hypothetical protein
MRHLEARATGRPAHLLIGLVEVSEGVHRPAIHRQDEIPGCQSGDLRQFRAGQTEPSRSKSSIGDGRLDFPRLPAWSENPKPPSSPCLGDQPGSLIQELLEVFGADLIGMGRNLHRGYCGSGAATFCRGLPCGSDCLRP